MSTTPRRIVSEGTRGIARTSETTAGIPEGMVEVTPEKRVTYPSNLDPKGLASFSSNEEGKEIRQAVPGKLGLTCDMPGNTYQHGEDGPEGTHFMSSGLDNPLITTPYVLCKHHLAVKQIQHAADPNIKFTPIRPQDIEKHKAKIQSIKDTATGTMEGSLLTGGYKALLPQGAPKPPRNVVIPPSDLMWGHETAGGSEAGTRGASLSSHLDEVNKRRSNLEKEDILNKALEKLRSNKDISLEEHDEHMDTYHSPEATLPKDSSGREYCPTCSQIYARTVDNAAEDAPVEGSGSGVLPGKWKLGRTNKEGVLRIPSWPKDYSAPDVRNAKPVEPKPKRVGQSLPSEAKSRESVSYGDAGEWAKAVLPAHLLINDEVTGQRAATPLEKFAEERLTKQVGEQGTAISNVEALTAAKLREIESFKKLSPREQVEYKRRKHLEEFGQGSGKPELESGQE